MAGFVNPVDLKRRTTNRWIIAAFFGFTGLLSLGLWLKGRDSDTSIFTPYKVSYKVETKKINAPNDTSRPTTEFLATVQNVLQGAQGNYSLYVYRLKEGKGYGINADAVMPAVSIMKVPIMTAVLAKIDAGNLALTDTYTLNAADIRSGSGPIEFMPPGTALTMDYLLKVAGQNSDNTAPVAMVQTVGESAVGDMIAKLGMPDTSFSDNTITASDLGMMWKNLYSGKVLSSSSHDILWTDLQNTIYEDRLSAGVPDDVEVIHKVGSDTDIWADTGIIMAPEPFVLSVLNTGVDLDEAKILLPKITKMVWNYETSRTTPSPQTPTTNQSK